MSIQVTCDGCGTQMKVGDQFAGKKGKCKKCGAVVRVPELAPEPVSVAAEPDMYDFAEPAPAQPKRAASAGTATLPPIPAAPARGGVAAMPPPPPPVPQATSAFASAAMSRGVVPQTAGAKSWQKTGNPPAVWFYLKIGAGVVLLLLGLLLAAGAVMALTADNGNTVRRPFKGLFFGLFLIVTGGGLIKAGFQKE